MEDGAATETQRHGAGEEGRWLVSNTWLTIIGTPPLFFVGVASKGFSRTVSLLFATLAERCISVASKEVTGEESLHKSNS